MEILRIAPLASIAILSYLRSFYKYCGWFHLQMLYCSNRSLKGFFDHQNSILQENAVWALRVASQDSQQCIQFFYVWSLPGVHIERSSVNSCSGDAGSSMIGSQLLISAPAIWNELISGGGSDMGVTANVGFISAAIGTLELTMLFSSGPGRASLALHQTWLVPLSLMTVVGRIMPSAWPCFRTVFQVFTSNLCSNDILAYSFSMGGSRCGRLVLDDPLPESASLESWVPMDP
ncbi:hypothetical protein DVH24_013695 [Malus domestica]|uniref:Uncharacterized protein n=1 Tax=Malus domestica TaxID=3750 RepID=A0A498JBD6_MALDO|nr:hypothetical protein DVH24_013695 [Malus domestica]